MPEHTADDLLRHRSFLTALARGLLRDPAAADDAVQDAYVQGLTASRRPGNVRGWLGKVTRNLALMRLRGERRRLHREHVAASRRGNAQEPAAETVARLEIQQRLVAAVRALPEADRTVIVLRYFDGLKAAEIARRLEVPASTVRTRVARALERLRADLDRDPGRRAWQGALGGLLDSTAGASLMGGTALAGLIATAAALGFALYLWWPRRAAPKRTTTPRPVAAVPADADSQDDAEPDTREPAPADSAEHTWRATGKVHTPDGTPVVVYLTAGSHKEELARTTVQRGRFFAELPRLAELSAGQRVGVHVYAAVRPPRRLPAESRHVALKPLEDAPRELGLGIEVPDIPAIHGRVVALDGTPAGGAEIWWSGEQDSAHADEQGRFALPLADREQGATVCAVHREQGIAVRTLSPVELAGTMPDLVLRAGERISGVVVYPDGAPVRDLALAVRPEQSRETFDRKFDPDKAVGLRSARTRTDEHGRFAVHGLAPGAYRIWIRGWHEHVVHTRAPETRVVFPRRRIIVRCVDEYGAPAWGASVLARSAAGTSAGDVPMQLIMKGRPVWRLSTGGGVLRPETREVRLAEHEYERTVELPVRVASRGALKLGEGPRLRLVDVETPDGNTVLFRMNPSKREFEVPVGHYRMKLELGGLDGHYLPYECDLTIRAGETTEIAVPARRGGRVRVLLRGPEKPVRLSWKLRDTRSRETTGPAIAVVRHGQGWKWGGPFPIGEASLVRGVLQPDSYDVTFLAPGFEPYTTRLHVRPGETADLEVMLGPKKRG